MFGKKCKLCDKKIKKDSTAEMQIDTAEGIHTIEICFSCADILDMAAEAAKAKRKPEEE